MTTNQQIHVIGSILLNSEESREARKLLKKLQQLQKQQITEEVKKIS